MRAKAIAVAAAIAFVGAVGSASAAENFSTLNGVPAEPLSAVEMEAAKGQFIVFISRLGRNHTVAPFDVHPKFGSICAGPPGSCSR